MDLFSMIAVGIMTPLLAYSVIGAWNSVISWRARNLSAVIRDSALGRIDDIATFARQSSNEHGQKLAEHLKEVVKDSDEMLDRGMELLSWSEDDRELTGEQKANVDGLLSALGPDLQHKFEELFPMLTTSSLLLHPEIGRSIYRAMTKTLQARVAIVSAGKERARFHAQAQNATPVDTSPDVFMHFPNRREEHAWAECA